MEDRKLNEQESLELITRMLQNTKMNLEVGSGNSLIIWGVSILLTNIVVSILFLTTHNAMSFWAWMLAPAIGSLWFKLAASKTEKFISKIDKMVSKLWLTTTIITVLLPFTFVALNLQQEQELIISGGRLMSLIPFMEMFIVSLALIANAIIIDFKPLRIGGLVGVALSLAMLCDSTHIHAIMFGTWAIASMIIPGIKLNYYIKSKKNV